MNRAYCYFFTLLGFVMGWIMGGPYYSNLESSYYHLSISVAAMLLIGLVSWLDRFRTKRIQNHWLAIRSMGKTKFILVYNILLRGFALVLVFFLVPYVVFGFTTSALRILAAAAVFLIASLAYLGHKEWQLNELTEPVKKLITDVDGK